MILSVSNYTVRVHGQSQEIRIDAEIQLPKTSITSMLPQKFERVISREESHELANELLTALAHMIVGGV